MLIKNSSAKIRIFFILRYIVIKKERFKNKFKRFKGLGDSKGKKRVVMAVTNDLVTDRRVMRHAAALRGEGYEVLLVGRNDLKVRCRRGWRFYAEYNLRLWWRLLRTRADVVWANDTDTLLGCYVAARMRGRKLVMDAHELFPEVPELIGRERVKRVWERLERRLMPKCDVLFTVCQSIADYYGERYGVRMTVVRNVSELKIENSKLKVVDSGQWVRSLSSRGIPVGSKDEGSAGSLKTLLYQGAVNKGRGVDWAIDALEFLPDCRLVVAGGGDLLEEMRGYAAGKPWAERVEFKGRLTPEELSKLTLSCGVRSSSSRSPQAVGLVMLEDMGLSYHFALPNRIGDFVAAGVPMVVSDLPEMASVVRRFGVGTVMEGTGGRALAEAVKRVLSRDWGEEDFAEARKDMDWEKEMRKMTECVNSLMC
jgi:glycosyltransferase involved in cell wall biosynthesis